MNDGGTIASYLLPFLSKIINLQHTSLFKLETDFQSKRIKVLLTHETTPNALYDILLTFSDTDKKFELKRNLPKKKTNKSYYVNFASLSVKFCCFNLQTDCFSMAKV